MARRVDPSIPGPIVELGPGTGPVTEALIRRGVPPDRLVLLEFDPAFCKLLRRRYPGCRIINGDAYALAQTLRGELKQPAAAVVSSLPLLTRPERQRLVLLAEAFELLHPGAPFIQFTYGLASPIPRRGGAPFLAKVSPPVLLNLPPARVWTYRAAVDAACDRSEAKRDLFDKLKASRLGEELRERRDRLRVEFQVRSSEAKAELRARTSKMRAGIEKHSGRMKAARASRGAMADERQPW